MWHLKHSEFFCEVDAASVWVVLMPSVAAEPVPQRPLPRFAIRGRSTPSAAFASSCSACTTALSLRPRLALLALRDRQEVDISLSHLPRMVRVEKVRGASKLDENTSTAPLPAVSAVPGRLLCSSAWIRNRG